MRASRQLDKTVYEVLEARQSSDRAATINGDVIIQENLQKASQSQRKGLLQPFGNNCNTVQQTLPDSINGRKAVWNAFGGASPEEFFSASD